MNLELTNLIIPFAAGLVLGLFYFGGMWLTVREIHKRQHPAAIAALSFLVRLTVAVFGFGVVVQGQWERLAACMVGFLIVRQMLIQRIRPNSDSLTSHSGAGQ